ncbi:hypothetical protein WP50_10970 [Lactiplantibacillus plantarum]|nr:hypothetical protein WP50_10970 [Lactiplantibacillus plantarum]
MLTMLTTELTHNLHKDEQLLAAYSDVEIRRFDFLDETTFDAALRGIQKVFFVRPPQLAKPKQDMWPFLKC